MLPMREGESAELLEVGERKLVHEFSRTGGGRRPGTRSARTASWGWGESSPLGYQLVVVVGLDDVSDDDAPAGARPEPLCPVRRWRFGLGS